MELKRIKKVFKKKKSNCNLRNYYSINIKYNIICVLSLIPIIPIYIRKQTNILSSRTDLINNSTTKNKAKVKNNLTFQIELKYLSKYFTVKILGKSKK